jgi:hypothetical protein
MKVFIIVLFSTFSIIETHPFRETDLVAEAGELKGAWHHEGSGNESTMICSGKYFSVASYDVETKKLRRCVPAERNFLHRAHRI